jgi:uncharacterized protein DUF4082
MRPGAKACPQIKSLQRRVDSDSDSDTHAHTLFAASDKPGTVTVNDPNSVELGVKFQTSSAGTITGIRFYKGRQNLGTHVGHLRSATGALLATANFTNETPAAGSRPTSPARWP